MATIHRFEDLICWKKGRELVKCVYKEFNSCKDFGFKDQIQRASVSIISNIAEGFESGTKYGFLNYLHIAKASAGEVRAQLYVAYDVGYLNIQTFENLKNLAEECSKLLNSFISKVKNSAMEGIQNKPGLNRDDVIYQNLLKEYGVEMTPQGIKKINSNP